MGESDKLTTCPLCGGRLKAGISAIPFVFEGTVIVVKNVPAETPFRSLMDDVLVGTGELKLIIGKYDQTKAPFMYQSMMKATKQDQVIELGLPVIYPVFDVMRIHMMLLGAAGKPATAITLVQGPADRWRNGSGFAAHVQYVSSVVFGHFNH